MRYMVIETFTEHARPVYERLAEHGRMLPTGLTYLDSWIEEKLDRGVQLMETDDARLIDWWTGQRGDLMEFEIVPVISSAEARARALGSNSSRTTPT